MIDITPDVANPSLYTSMTETDQAAFRDWLRGLLLEQEITVEFMKKDGSARTMRCTLRDAPVTEGNSRRQPSTSSLSVWDLDAQAWRSFCWDRIQSIQAQTA